MAIVIRRDIKLGGELFQNVISTNEVIVLREWG